MVDLLGFFPELPNVLISPVGGAGSDKEEQNSSRLRSTLWLAWGVGNGEWICLLLAGSVGGEERRDVQSVSRPRLILSTGGGV